MSFWSQIARLIWKGLRYLFLIVFSTIVGAHLGSFVGIPLAAITSDSQWLNHARCAGWTLFALVAMVGAPLGWVSYCADTVKRRRPRRNEPPASSEPNDESSRVEVQCTVGGIRALLIAPLIGAFMGLIVGGMLGGFLIAFYFFVALSPFGPGGWWPVLPLTFQSAGDGFRTENSLIMYLWLTVVGSFVVLGSVGTLCCGVSCGKTHYRLFGGKK